MVEEKFQDGRVACITDISLFIHLFLYSITLFWETDISILLCSWGWTLSEPDKKKRKLAKKKKKKVRKLCIQLTNKGKQPDYYSRSNWGKQSFNTADLWCPEMITLYFLYVFTPRGPRLDLCKNVNLAKASLQCIIILPSHQLHKLLQTLNWGTWGLPIRGTYSEHQQSKRPKERKVKNLISDIFF